MTDSPKCVMLPWKIKITLIKELQNICLVDVGWNSFPHILHTFTYSSENFCGIIESPFYVSIIPKFHSKVNDIIHNTANKKYQTSIIYYPFCETDYAYNRVNMQKNELKKFLQANDIDLSKTEKQPYLRLFYLTIRLHIITRFA